MAAILSRPQCDMDAWEVIMGPNQTSVPDECNMHNGGVEMAILKSEGGVFWKHNWVQFRNQ